MAHWFASNGEIVASFGFNAMLGFSVWLVLACGRAMLGSTAFALIGAVVTAAAASSGWNVGVAATAGVACAAAAGAIFGAVAARAKSAQFAIATLVLAGWASWAATSAVPHARVVPAVSAAHVIAALAIVALVSWFVAASRQGRAAACIAQDEWAAQTLGIAPERVRLVAVVAGAIVAGLYGALMVLHRGHVTPDDFSIERNVVALAAAVVGGAGSAGGPIVGAALLGVAGSASPLKQYATIVDVTALLGVSVLLPGGVASAVAKIVRR